MLSKKQTDKQKTRKENCMCKHAQTENRRVEGIHKNGGYLWVAGDLKILKSKY